MVKLNKKAYLRTLEAMIAVVLTFSVIAYITTSKDDSNPLISKNLLSVLSLNDDFRDNALNLTDCISNSDNFTINDYIEKETGENLNYVLCPSSKKPSLPRTSVNAESIYLTPKYSSNSSKIIRIYYWE